MHIPIVTEADLIAFGQKHFDIQYPPAFQWNFSTEAFVEEDDELGYYSDGAKRTLTDEQVAIFRYSEVQQAIREKHARMIKNRKRNANRVKQKQAAAERLIEAARAEAEANATNATNAKTARPTEDKMVTDDNPPAAIAEPANPPAINELNDSADEGEISDGSYAKSASATGNSTNAASPAESSTTGKKRSRRAQQHKEKLRRRAQVDRKRERAALKHHEWAERKAENEYTPRREAREQDEIRNVQVDLDY